MRRRNIIRDNTIIETITKKKETREGGDRGDRHCLHTVVVRTTRSGKCQHPFLCRFISY